MKIKNLLITLMFVLVSAPALTAQCVDCPACDTEMAVGFLEKSSNSKTVYEVKQKEIAVPNICLPCKLFSLREQLQNLTASKCCPDKPCGCPIGECPKQLREGKIKVVKVMSKKKVKCDACAYEWKVADIEDVNEYLYDFEEAPQEQTPAKATAAPAIEAEPAPVEVKEVPLLEVPAAPKMGWQDRPLFPSKKDPVTFAPATTTRTQATHFSPAASTLETLPMTFKAQRTTISAEPSTVTAYPSQFASPLATIKNAAATSKAETAAIISEPAKIVSQSKTLKALPASTSSAFLIRRPGPQN